MTRLLLMRAEHGSAVRAFELANREYFAASVPDRGDAYFKDFDVRHSVLLAEQDAGMHYFHVLVAPEGEVVGRVNLIDVADGTAELGYRVAKHATGRGLATAAVRTVCVRAGAAYGLTSLRAVTTLDNPASLAVLARTGFEAVGEEDVDGRPGLRFARDLRDVRELRDPRNSPTAPKANP
ncbi:GNAT family N-acetyltransferase [Streptomycetaceae bacterium NBC_01309]